MVPIKCEAKLLYKEFHVKSSEYTNTFALTTFWFKNEWYYSKSYMVSDETVWILARIPVTDYRLIMHAPSALFELSSCRLVCKRYTIDKVIQPLYLTGDTRKNY